MSLQPEPEVTVLRRVQEHWWAAVAGLVSVPVLWAAGILDDFAEGVVVAAVLYLVWGLARHRHQERSWLLWQVPGVVVFGAATVIAVRSDESTAAYVLAAGWVGHAAWDVVHFRADRIVPRWWSLWCVVLDVLLATVLVATA